MRHADDTVLFAGNKEDLQQLLDIVEKASRKKGLKSNRKKTEVLVVSRNKECPQMNIFIDGNKTQAKRSIQTLGYFDNE